MKPEIRTIKLSLSVLLKNEFWKDSLIIGDVYFHFNEKRYDYSNVSNGWYVFTNIPIGKATLKIFSSFYFLATFQVEIVDPPSLEESCYIFYLTPRPNYPFPEDASLIRGLVCDESNQPLEDAQIQGKYKSDKGIDKEFKAFSDNKGAYRGYYVASLNLKDKEKSVELVFAKPGFLAQSLVVIARAKVTTFITPVILKEISEN